MAVMTPLDFAQRYFSLDTYIFTPEESARGMEEAEGGEIPYQREFLVLHLLGRYIEPPASNG